MIDLISFRTLFKIGFMVGLGWKLADFLFQLAVVFALDWVNVHGWF